MMPRVGPQSRAAKRRTRLHDAAKKQFLGHNHRDEHDESEFVRRSLRRANLMHALHGDEQSRAEQGQRDQDAGHRLGLAVAEGMIGIRRQRGETQRRPDDERAEDIRERLDAVGHQHVGIADETGGDLHHGQRQIDDDGRFRKTQC